MQAPNIGPRRVFHTTDYRYPNEQLIFGLTVLLVLGVIAFTAAATLCGSGLFVLGMLVFAYAANRVHHDDLIKRARRVSSQSTPGLARAVAAAAARLQPGPVQTYVAPGAQLNAYTFGLTDPKVVVMFAGLLRNLDEEETRFVVGHEMGHVRLGHTWLNSMIGGMAGIPSPFGAAVLLYFAFRWWNRACEFSADRAGLLACGRPDKAVSALVKLTGALTPAEQQLALVRLDAEDDDPANVLGELLSTHPMIVRRIDALRRYAASADYRRLQALVDQNVEPPD